MAVITASIGRSSLEKAILSVQQQSYPCQHYVFIDGKAHWQKVQPLIKKYPNVIFTLLPMNTGTTPTEEGYSRCNGAILAVAPYLVNEEVLCYLDDDNWYDRGHIRSLMAFMCQHQLDYAYSLRRLYRQDGTFLCDDDRYSLGFWRMPDYRNQFIVNNMLYDYIDIAQHLIDTNCFAIRRSLCFELAPSWYKGFCNDKYVTQQLFELTERIKGGCTAQRTVNYLFSLNAEERRQLLASQGEAYYHIFQQNMYDRILDMVAQDVKRQVPCPWLTPTIYYQGQLTPV